MNNVPKELTEYILKKLFIDEYGKDVIHEV